MDANTPATKVSNWAFSASIFDGGAWVETIDSSAFAVSEEALQDQLEDRARSNWGDEGSVEIHWAENLGQL